MPAPDPPLPFARAQRVLLLGARAGLSGALAMVPAWLGSVFAPAGYAWLVYAIVGGTAFMVAWWAVGRMFAKVGLVVK